MRLRKHWLKSLFKKVLMLQDKVGNHNYFIDLYRHYNELRDTYILKNMHTKFVKVKTTKYF